MARKGATGCLGADLRLQHIFRMTEESASSNDKEQWWKTLCPYCCYCVRGDSSSFNLKYASLAEHQERLPVSSR